MLNKNTWGVKNKGVGIGPAGPVLAGPLFNSLAYMVKQNCMFEKAGNKFLCLLGFYYQATLCRKSISTGTRLSATHAIN